MNNPELDNFLDKVDDVHETINKIMKGEIDQKSYEEIERRINSQKYEQIEKEKKQKILEEQKRIKEQKKLLGKEGKGQGDDYLYYCERCCIEYEIELKKCNRCQRYLMTKEQRKKDLIKKVEEFKIDKQKREERKKRWELWQKTKKIYKKAKLIDYEKWNYFTDSEDSDKEFKENNPILPKNDPQFQMMEKDIKKKQEKRKESQKIAENLKQKGNQLFQQKQYYDAIQEYSKGIEVDRNNKALWLNRALARIKFGQNKEAISDCSQMIEYMEILEDGFIKSKNFAIKALLRRSLAYYNLNLISESFQDAKKVFEIDENDKEVKNHYQMVEKKMKILNLTKNQTFKEDQNKLQDILQQEDKWRMFLKEIKDNKNAKAAFLIDDIYVQNMKNDLLNLDVQFESKNLLKMNVLQFIEELTILDEVMVTHLMQNKLYFEIIKLLSKLSQNFEQQNDKNFDELKIFFQIESILNCLAEFSMYQRGRNYLIEKFLIITQVFNIFIKSQENNLNQNTLLIGLLLKIISNCFYGLKESQKLKKISLEFYQNQKKNLFDLLYQSLNNKKIVYCEVIHSIFSLITNLLNNEKIREEFILDLKFFKEKTFLLLLKKLQQLKNEKNQTTFQNLLNDCINFLHNLQFKNQTILQEILPEEFKIFWIDTFIKQQSKLQKQQYENYLSSLKRLIFNNKQKPLLVQILFDKKFEESFQTNNPNQLILTLNAILTQDVEQKYFEKNLNKNLKIIKNFIDQEQNIVPLNNTLVFLTTFVEKIPNVKIEMINLLEPLTKIVKDKTGILRKSAAILIAKLCQEPKVLERARELHATEILINLKNFL